MGAFWPLVSTSDEKLLAFVGPLIGTSSILLCRAPTDDHEIPICFHAGELDAAPNKIFDAFLR